VHYTKVNSKIGFWRAAKAPALENSSGNFARDFRGGQRRNGTESHASFFTTSQSKIAAKKP